MRTLINVLSIIGINERKLWMQKLTSAITKAKEHENEIEKNNRKLGKIPTNSKPLINCMEAS